MRVMTHRPSQCKLHEYSSLRSLPVGGDQFLVEGMKGKLAMGTAKLSSLIALDMDPAGDLSTHPTLGLRGVLGCVGS